MRIQQVEQEVGISKTNIRFYEAEGLISPRREGANGYRDYSQEDVAALRRIKLLRKLDVPLPEVKAMLAGQITLAEGMRRHQLLLEHRRADLAAARELCESLAQRPGPLGALDAEAFLETTSRISGLSSIWEVKALLHRSSSLFPTRDPWTGALGVAAKKPEMGGFSSFRTAPQSSDQKPMGASLC